MQRKLDSSYKGSNTTGKSFRELLRPQSMKDSGDLCWENVIESFIF